MFKGKIRLCVCSVTVSIEMGKQTLVEEKNENVGGGDDPAAVMKGVSVKNGLVARNKNLLSFSKEQFVRWCQEPL